LKIGLIADTHDRLDKIRVAVGCFREEGVECVVHCGDFVAPFALKPFKELGVRFISVFGNNDGEKEGLKKVIKAFGEVGEPPIVVEIGGNKIVISHSPIEDAEILGKYREASYVFHGHTHDAVVREVGQVKAVNPGEACGWLSGKSTMAVVDLETGECEIIEI
jgi:putative phosphoesterase